MLLILNCEKKNVVEVLDIQYCSTIVIRNVNTRTLNFVRGDSPVNWLVFFVNPSSIVRFNNDSLCDFKDHKVGISSLRNGVRLLIYPPKLSPIHRESVCV
jgi:hypothetical protein